MRHRTRSHLVLVVIIGDVVRHRSAVRVDLGGDAGNISCAYLVEGCIGGVGLRFDPCSEEALHQRRHQLGLRIAPKLEQRLDDLRQIRNAAVLVRALTVHDVENIRQAGLGAVSLNTLPLLRLAGDLVRVGVADVIGDHAAVAIHLHAVVDLVACAGLSLGDLALHEAADGDTAAIFAWRAGAVRLHDVQPQGIGV